MKTSAKKIFVLGMVLTISSFASAATYAWDSVSGCYNEANQIQGIAVTYDTVAADTGLWGAMQTSGDALLFFPTTFQAGVSGEAGNDWVDETLQFDLGLKPGGAANRIIDSILFAEAGHYTLSGTGTDLTYASVSCAVIFTILEIDGAVVEFDPFDPLKYIINDSLTFSSDGVYDLPGDEGTLADWSGSLNHVFANDGLGGNVTRVHVSINNWLEVNSQDGTTSFIEKKVAFDQPSVSIAPTIPEPSSIAMMGLVSGLGLFVRRKFMV